MDQGNEVEMLVPRVGAGMPRTAALDKNALWEELLCHILGYRVYRAQGAVFTAADNQLEPPRQGVGCIPLHSTGY